MTTTTHTPNHHAHFHGFAGLPGLLLGLALSVGRGRDAQLALRLAEVGPADRVVDVGCGTGTAARAAARRGAGVTGVDPADVMLRLARRFTRGRRVRYLDGSAEALPVPDRSATVLWSIATVHHWKDLAQGLGETRRVLEPGGRFVAIERRTEPGATGHRSHGWTDEQAAAFVDVCRTAGLEDVRVEHATTSRGPVVAVVARNP
jgi:ubiquinone/menaquinone biosynthesis C-methylase UbiE